MFASCFLRTLFLLSNISFLFQTQQYCITGKPVTLPLCCLHSQNVEKHNRSRHNYHPKFHIVRHSKKNIPSLSPIALPFPQTKNYIMHHNLYELVYCTNPCNISVMIFPPFIKHALFAPRTRILPG